MTRSALVAALTGALVVALAGLAAAHTKFFTTTQPPVRFENGTYSGHLQSPKAKCLANRTIVIRPAAGGDTIARGKSKADGTFEFDGAEPPRTTIEAEAKKKRIKKTSSHKHVCLASKTHVIARR
jgi:hypothetical protein